MTKRLKVTPTQVDGENGTLSEARAITKRARKAAKRLRDAELTRLRRELARATIERDSVWHSWCRGSASKLNSAANARMNAARDGIDAIRRGEVTQ